MSHASETTRAIIFDLDDTLYDCSGTLVHSGRLKAARVIASAIGCSEEEAYKLQIEKEAAPNNDGIYEAIARDHSLPPSFLEGVENALSEIDISGIRPFEGVVDALNSLKERGLMLFLVTGGKHEGQEKKIHTLGLDNVFDEVTILETLSPEAKKASFKEILNRHGLRPEEVLCVGDRMDRELRVAKELGIRTAMVKHGRHYQRFISAPKNDEGPNIYLDSVADLPGIIGVRQPSR